MRDWIEGLPLIWSIAFFTAGALLRGSTTYALGRAMAAGAELSKLRKFMASPVYKKAAEFVDRWGPFAVPLSFLTVGVQSAVMLSTGLARMRVWKFIPGVLIGAIIWGTLYGTVGMAVVWTWLSQPWIVALAVTVVAILSFAWWATDGFAFVRRVRTRKPRKHAGAAQATAADPDPEHTAGQHPAPPESASR